VRGLLEAALLMGIAAAAGAAERQPIGHGAQFVLRPRASCGGAVKKAIFAHPPWKGIKGRVIGQFDIHLNDATDPELHFFMGIQDGHGSDKGVIYRVLAAGKEIWSAWHNASAWKPVTVSLEPFAGKAIKLELAVDSLGEHWANWGEPRILDQGKVLYDLADLARQAAKLIEPMDSIPEDQLPAGLRRERERLRRQSVLVRPTPQQLAWQEMEFIAFTHFGINTFTNREWGTGREDPKLFNPSVGEGLQASRHEDDHPDGKTPRRLLPVAEQVHRPLGQEEPVARGQGRRGARGGRGLPPRRTEVRRLPLPLGPPRAHLRRLPGLQPFLHEPTDEGPNGRRQVYDWPAYYAMIRGLQPNALIAICGPDIRWVGNESGVARQSEWSVQPANLTRHGKTGLVWYPAECDVSIRPGWFYHPQQDKKVKSLKRLLDIYFKSVGRNSVLLLNVPPDRRGLIHENDARRLRELRAALDAIFRTDLVQDRPGRGEESHGLERPRPRPRPREGPRRRPDHLVDGRGG